MRESGIASPRHGLLLTCASQSHIYLNQSMSRYRAGSWAREIRRHELHQQAHRCDRLRGHRSRSDHISISRPSLADNDDTGALYVHTAYLYDKLLVMSAVHPGVKVPRGKHIYLYLAFDNAQLGSCARPPVVISLELLHEVLLNGLHPYSVAKAVHRDH